MFFLITVCSYSRYRLRGRFIDLKLLNNIIDQAFVDLVKQVRYNNIIYIGIDIVLKVIPLKVNSYTLFDIWFIVVDSRIPQSLIRYFFLLPIEVKSRYIRSLQLNVAIESFYIIKRYSINRILSTLFSSSNQHLFFIIYRNSGNNRIIPTIVSISIQYRTSFTGKIS